MYSYSSQFSLFDYPKPPLENKLKFVGHFMLFSAFQSINGSYFRIHSTSSWVSIVMYSQSLYVIFLISLLVSDFVSGKTNDSKRDNV